MRKSVAYVLKVDKPRINLIQMKDHLAAVGVYYESKDDTAPTPLFLHLTLPCLVAAGCFSLSLPAALRNETINGWLFPIYAIKLKRE